MMDDEETGKGVEEQSDKARLLPSHLRGPPAIYLNVKLARMDKKDRLIMDDCPALGDLGRTRMDSDGLGRSEVDSPLSWP